jgi:AcrR family transcriptional regulator
VANLLEAAAAEIGDAGYEAATMSSIARRAHASIGSLYQFFPNKVALVQALRGRYCEEFEQLWAPLSSEAEHLSLVKLVSRMADSAAWFIERHPAFLVLLDAPCNSHSSAAIQERFQKLVASFLLARRPRMSRAKALRLAVMILQTFKALNSLYRDLAPAARRPYIQEFKTLLRQYLECRMNHRDNGLRNHH